MKPTATSVRALLFADDAPPADNELNAESAQRLEALLGDLLGADQELFPKSFNPRDTSEPEESTQHPTTFRLFSRGPTTVDLNPDLSQYFPKSTRVLEVDSDEEDEKRAQFASILVSEGDVRGYAQTPW
ncbi:hypothetical protein HK104_004001, partial [Borealophlyctis nickersoniae]